MPKSKQLWVWHWIGGGYNYVYAADRAEALAAAKEMAKVSGRKVNERSLHAAIPEELAVLNKVWKGPTYETNPEGSGLGFLAVAGAAALGIGWLVMSDKKASAAEAPAPTPSTQACPSAAQVKAFAYSKSLSWFANPTPPTAPPTNAQWTPEARVYSESDCSFYKWAFGPYMFHWEKDVALTNELRAAQLQQAVQGVSAVHPFMGALSLPPT